MNDRSHKIAINSSSIIELKAELLRKKAELKQTSNQSKPSNNLKGNNGFWNKKNKDVEARANQDLEAKIQEIDSIDQSKKMLQLKAKLYEKMSKGDVTEHPFLVDFEMKNKSIGTNLETSVETNNISRTPANLPHYINNLPYDEALKDKAFMHDNHSNNPIVKNHHIETNFKNSPEVESKMNFCNDIEQKSSVHYSDIKADEIRTHGVGFFEFATSETLRDIQLEELNELRKQTKEQRAQQEKIKEKRKREMEIRLAKVRQRSNLQNLETEVVKDTDVKIDDHDEDEENLLVRDNSWRLLAPEREWDKGKKRTYDEANYVAEKRENRDKDFAPPSFYNEVVISAIKNHPKTKPKENKLFKNCDFSNNSAQSNTNNSDINNIQFNNKMHVDSEIMPNKNYSNEFFLHISGKNEKLLTEENDSTESKYNTEYSRDNINNVQTSSSNIQCYTNEDSYISHNDEFSTKYFNASSNYVSNNYMYYPAVIENIDNNQTYNNYSSSMSNVPQSNISDNINNIDSHQFNFPPNQILSYSSEDIPISKNSKLTYKDHMAPNPVHYSSTARKIDKSDAIKMNDIKIHELPPMLPLPPVIGAQNNYSSQNNLTELRKIQEENAAAYNWQKNYPSNYISTNKQSLNTIYKNNIEDKYDKMENFHGTNNNSIKQYINDSAKRINVVSKSHNKILHDFIKPNKIPFVSPYVQNIDAPKICEDERTKIYDPSIMPPLI